MPDSVSPAPTGRIALLAARRGALLDAVRVSDLARAAGLAGAMIASNVVALGTTLAFGRLLGVSGYGSLGALISALVILQVPGAALQAAVAREGALGRLGRGGDLAATLARWTRRLGTATLAVIVVSVLARHPIARAIGVRQEWAAASALPAGCLWLMLSIQRGLYQSLSAYKVVGVSMVCEQGGRLLFGVGLAVAGAGVTGAYVGAPLGMLAVSLVLGWRLHARLGPERSDAPPHRLRALVRGGWAPIVGLTLVAVLQNIDVIVAKHLLSPHAAGSYAAAAVAGKVVIWVAIGVGFYLLPEATRRHAAGEDTRPVLARALGLIAAVSIPALAIFAGAPRLLMRLAFGAKYLDGAHALLVLGLAMTLLAAGYLAVQYLLALHRTAFLAVLGAVAVAEPLLLVLAAPRHSLAGFAAVVLAVQAVAAAVVLGAAVMRRRPRAVS